MRRAARLAAALLAGTALLSAALSAGTMPAVAATSATGTSRPALTVVPRQGGIVQSGGSLTMTVSIANSGSATLPAASLYVSVDADAVTSTTALAARIAKPSTDSVIVGKGTSTPVIPSGGEKDVRVTVSASSLESLLGAAPVPGARVVTAQLRSGGATTAVAATAITVLGSGFASSVTVGTIVPITAPATRTGLLTVQQLSDLTGEFGAWTDALEAVESTRAVIALDPMVIASITVQGTAAPQSARDFLAQLQQLPNESFALPYGDSDLSLEHAAGAASVLPVSSLAGDVDAADFTGLPSATPTDSGSVDASGGSTPTPTATSSVAGVPTTDQLLNWPYTSTTIGWPAGGIASASDLAFLKRSKLTTVLLSSSAVKDTAARRAAGPLATTSGTTALIADGTLSALLTKASGPDDAASRGALAQLFATLAIDASTGSAPTVLMTASRVDEDSTTLNHVLTAMAGQTWIHGTDLDSMLAQTTLAPVTLQRTAVASTRADAARALLTGDAHVRSLSRAVDPVDTFVGPQRLKVLALLSNAWRDEKTWPAAAAATAASLESTASNQVTIKLSKTVNVLSSDGTLPVTIVNNLGQSVEVVVRGAPSNAKMTIGSGEETTIPDGSVATVKLPVKVISNGEANLTLVVETPQGWRLSSETVAVTLNAGWETIGAVVVSAALLLLFGTGVYRNLTKRRRAVRRSAARRAARERAS